MRCWCSRRLASSARHALAHRDQLVAGHQLGDRRAWSLAKRTSRLVRMPTSLPLPRSTTGMPEIWCSAISASASARVCVGMDGDRVDHHAGFEFLDLADFVGLLLGIEVLVDDADAAGLRHGDGQAAFGHGIHRRGDQRDAELDRAGDAGAGVGLVGRPPGGGLQQDIVEGERSRNCMPTSERRNKTAVPFGGRRVGGSLYTLPRINQANWRGRLAHRGLRRGRGNPVSLYRCRTDERLRRRPRKGNRSSTSHDFLGTARPARSAGHERSGCARSKSRPSAGERDHCVAWKPARAGRMVPPLFSATARMEIPSKMKGAFKNAILVAVVLVVCALLLEAMTRLFVDDGVSYELEMWSYRDRREGPRPAPRHGPQARRRPRTPR